MGAQQQLDLSRRAVSQPNPDHLWGFSFKYTAIRKVGVFRDDCEMMSFRIVPNGAVIAAAKSDVSNVFGAGEEI